MNTIVVVFVRTSDVKLTTGQPVAVSIKGSSQDVAVLHADKTSGADKSTIHNESIPPFWTWFIENPRPIIQDRSVALRI
jgi:hypothetical protein